MVADAALRADLVVVGAGVAGLTAAVRAAEAGMSVVVLNKGRGWRPDDLDPGTATYFAQGGIAVVEPDNDEDSVALHTRDTVVAGAGLTDEVATASILGDGFAAVSTLIDWGARFDRGSDGRFLRTREGGHSVRRVIHAGGDATGAQVQRSLATRALSHARIRVIDESHAQQVLLSADGTAVGVRIGSGDGHTSDILAPTTVLATGGAGHMYRATTNPLGSTGDGIALAYSAGAAVADMEFIQFHPTMLYRSGVRGRRTLITEALRGEGAILVDVDGHSVTDGVHPLGDLAPRDVVAHAVTTAMARTGAEHVYLDARHISDFARRFPTVTAGVAVIGVDPSTDLIPVVPGAHYLCGGIVTDAAGATSIPGLYAAGEVARTGLHGANRLASNSLLEGLVMGRRVADAAIGRKGGAAPSNGPVAATELPIAPRGDLQNQMSDHAALSRDHIGLSSLAEYLQSAPRRRPRTATDHEDAALTVTALLVVHAALARKESRGCHHRTDEPGA
ncbi:L-aspartate oxidase [Williamsia limnetica]|uniref:L-aspartate oxidase n=1 Tax=Williamsia limnetica TaxID=882452 RepID=A0A318S309_WILLI|nr:L-aspartate oxidase [Williamsia limnetica]PYE18017.1 L-aspartate oxidase [Williamsia limnetica]